MDYRTEGRIRQAIIDLNREIDLLRYNPPNNIRYFREIVANLTITRNTLRAILEDSGLED